MYTLKWLDSDNAIIVKCDDNPTTNGNEKVHVSQARKNKEDKNPPSEYPKSYRCAKCMKDFDSKEKVCIVDITCPERWYIATSIFPYPSP